MRTGLLATGWPFLVVALFTAWIFLALPSCFQKATGRVDSAKHETLRNHPAEIKRYDATDRKAPTGTKTACPGDETVIWSSGLTMGWPVKL